MKDIKLTLRERIEIRNNRVELVVVTKSSDKNLTLTEIKSNSKSIDVYINGELKVKPTKILIGDKVEALKSECSCNLSIDYLVNDQNKHNL